MSKKDFIPYNSQVIDEDDIKAVSEALKKPYLTTGPAVEEFERVLAEYLGVEYVVVCANGTASLHLTMMALDIGPGDKVITSPITFIADANAPRFCGAEVIFADINPKTVNLDPWEVRKILEQDDSVKAIIPVHFAGQACDMEEFNKLSKEFDVHIVEDGCHALGGSYLKESNEVKVGSCSDSLCTTFSFHPIKNITTGEGGAITTNDEDLYRKLLLLRSHGNTRNPDEFINDEFAYTYNDKTKLINPWYYEMKYLSYNYRLTDFQAALGISQLRKLDSFVEKRNSLSNLYDNEFSKLQSDKIHPLKNYAGNNHGRHLYVIKAPMENIQGGRANLMNKLLKEGIQTQVHYIPIHYQLNYQHYFKDKQHFPFAEDYYRDCLSLPLFAGMTEEDVKLVVSSLNEITDQNWID